MPVTTAIFDAFGTLVKIGEGTHPYRKILKLGIEQGRRPKANDAEVLMSSPMDLREAADYFGIRVESVFLSQLEADLQDELASIEAYPDGLATVAALQAAGIKVAVCSNLAKPYASAIERLYPTLDGYSFSFAVGVIKPSSKIYSHATHSVQAPPHETWMIGDSKLCDCDGPARIGIRGFFLDRKGSGGYTTLYTFANEILRAL
ncbi:HAD family hydrolase [Pseudomonas sp. CFBP 13711]|uniref:HAD family hydrolase n=1 Tax=unclassified Pseudomonas TaxID=196821 RepID=UPI00177A775B|nr:MULTISPECIES: HAD family hydrolase [unclassified Pseudomonas]MBD8707181.1 HAD family hydrolase [Pseudomonas sp. CFBP 13711]MBD8714804.1 HAD family hydrolase [Pseudomonas sp. CFBP 13715]